MDIYATDNILVAYDFFGKRMSMLFGVIVAVVVRVTAGRNHRRSAVVTAGLFSFAAGGEGKRRYDR